MESEPLVASGEPAPLDAAGPTPSPAPPASGARRWGPLLVATLMLLGGIALREPLLHYHGPPEEHAQAVYTVHHMGAYSDIAQLYFRDQLWRHPLPYFDYTFEYPVLTGLFVWLMAFVHGSVVSYFLVSAVALSAAALAVVWLSRGFTEANPWLIALAPALALDTVLNWDMLGILLTVIALLLVRRERDAWAGAAMAAAIWAKFFPIVAVPLIVFDRLLERRWRDAATFSTVLLAVSVALNAPVALQPTGGLGLQLRDSWLYFFRFNAARGPQPWSANLWNLLDPWHIHPAVRTANSVSLLLMALALGATLGLMYLAYRRGRRRRVLAASIIMLAMFLFSNKIYSPQYSIWLAVLPPLAGLAPALAAAFAGADLLFFGGIWAMAYLRETHNPAEIWLYQQWVWPAMILRELITLAIVFWLARSLLQREAGDEPFSRLEATRPRS